jgi:hypothetical protein
MRLDLLRRRLPELVLARPRHNGDPTPVTVTVSLRVLGLHPLLSVVLTLAFRPNGNIIAATASGSTWSISALQKNDGQGDLLVLDGADDQLVTNHALPAGFETASAAEGLQADCVLGVPNASVDGDWVATLSACPVDAELIFKCPELLEALYLKLQLVPMQLVQVLGNTAG